MGNSDNYFINRDDANLLKIREIRKELPHFCAEFFRGIEQDTTPLTRLGYARDLKLFFNFLVNEVEEFYQKPVLSLDYPDLEKITSTHLEMFMEYISLYKDNGKTYRNGEKAKARKLSSVRAMLKYFFKKNTIISNVAEKVDTPKIRTGEIIRLEYDEIAKLLNISETGERMTKMEQGFHKHTRIRDYAMLSLFLGTGIRISECVGLNIDDLDFSQNAFKITRKGGSKVILYFNDEVSDALQAYLYERNANKNVPPTEKALFLSLQNRRISVRAVEKLVKKYTSYVTPLKKITPHKLRSTFGTNLYKETKDIYIVADVLGHKDVNTTRKHYAAISDDIRREAATKVKFRKD
ncbi:MAG: tyrosine-type recombinase/integrase [Clostridia bacterium]|nr:tyrosine-type recombinase/integrase [Clostridia bacterium]